MLVPAVTIGAFAAGELVQALRRRPGATRADVRSETAFRLVFFAGILMLPLSRAVVPGAVVHAVAIGFVLAWLGLLLRWWSFLTLGRYFTVVVMTSEDQPVVDRGPYRFVRHPSYTALLLIFTGIGLMLQNWLGTVAAVTLVLIALLHRIRIEERALTAALGEHYRTFAATRARLIPYVW
ncbi:methyltransferase family protein [Paractinoplanes atraurantiacus]|uniref:Isoprenylcysteine carboxyl methyltransferase (ICMT) family protein n=1 Tax=Paractinoplanes atraurantiacus TaxID=1036182 RepID=A0A285IHE6_9ACTN|nr:isoprenylcysteine carboxylmethyltransferase family protein [Actinoplanes atraurantiacus]SNY47398.1 Isoprenylcysteine carboxyl methyltransferase (ICMT) family protein [Actinoplanes atraurantiacus]